jgi:hypothetical protein
MAEQRSDDLLRSRQEAALLLRLDPSNLSPADALKCDLIATLRLSIDSAQADALEGRAADLGRLIVATESLVKLLPSEPPKPAAADDHEAAIAPLLKLYRYLHGEVHTLSAENAQLRAALGLKGLPNSGEIVHSTAITPPLADIVPASERAECDAGVKPGPDDRRARRSTTVIEGRPNPPGEPRNWDDTDNGRKWRAWVDAGGAHYDRWSNRNGA